MTDTTNLVVTIRNFAKAPKVGHDFSFLIFQKSLFTVDPEYFHLRLYTCNQSKREHR